MRGCFYGKEFRCVIVGDVSVAGSSEKNEEKKEKKERKNTHTKTGDKKTNPTRFRGDICDMYN